MLRSEPLQDCVAVLMCDLFMSSVKKGGKTRDQLRLYPPVISVTQVSLRLDLQNTSSGKIQLVEYHRHHQLWS